MPAATFDWERDDVVFGPGALVRLGEIAAGLGLRRVFLVADPGLRAPGHLDRARGALQASGLLVETHADVVENPDEPSIARAADALTAFRADGLVALGGGSALDTAKGAALLATSGGLPRDYRGHGKAGRALPPMIGIPTTAGTGSEAQSYALISHAETHEKMAIGDPGLVFRVVILDPDLLATVPRRVAAAAGYDAIAHAVETAVTTRKSDESLALSLEAFAALVRAFPGVLDEATPSARADMMRGAHLAGRAIEASMLGAAHACANPLSARFAAVHGEALSTVLPHVVRFNAEAGRDGYAGLCQAAGWESADPARTLAVWLEGCADRARLPRSIAAVGARPDDVDALAFDAAVQWTGTFNPRPFDAAAAREVYRCAL